MASVKRGLKRGDNRDSMDSVVKIDSAILSEVEEFINKVENRLIYTTKKQFVSMAVLEKLKKEGSK